MDYRNLLYVLLYAFYQILEMIKDVFALVFILPIRIIQASYMNTSDAFPYIRGEFYCRLNRLKTHGLTFQLILKNGKPSVTVRSYFEEAELLADVINKRKYKSTKKLIEEALLTVKKCMYVILEVDESSMKFIQFRYDGNTYCFDFPLTPKTLNRDYSTDIINLLRARGFTKYNRVRGYAFKYKTYSIYPLEDEMTTINADFGNDFKLAVDTGSYIFEKIFQTKSTPRVVFG